MPTFVPLEKAQFPFQRKVFVDINNSMIMHTRGKDRPNLTYEEYNLIWKYNSHRDELLNQWNDTSLTLQKRREARRLYR